MSRPTIEEHYLNIWTEAENERPVTSIIYSAVSAAQGYHAPHRRAALSIGTYEHNANKVTNTIKYAFKWPFMTE